MPQLFSIALIAALLAAMPSSTFAQTAETPPDESQAKPFDAPAPREDAPPDDSIALFNGKDLTGWTHHTKDEKVKMEDVWSVKDGVLICKGNPIGYIKTEQDYENYVLSLQWRWKPGMGGNSGVLVHTSTPNAVGVWPKSIEVQLQSGNAGDFWVIGTELNVENEEKRRSNRRFHKLIDDAERPLGNWNTMEITCKGDEILVKVNGKLVNHATNCSETRGAICLQSEGAEIHFRNVRLTPLPKMEVAHDRDNGSESEE